MGTLLASSILACIVIFKAYSAKTSAKSFIAMEALVSVGFLIAQFKRGH